MLRLLKLPYAIQEYIILTYGHARAIIYEYMIDDIFSGDISSKIILLDVKRANDHI